MIILKRDGQFGRFYKRYDIDLPTNLCQLFWRTFFVSLGFVFLGVFIGLYFMGAVMIFINSNHPSAVIFAIASIAATVIYVCHKWDSWRSYRIKRPPSQWRQNVGEAYKGFKEKFCPLVRFEDV